ncbi:hypothetical protein KY363_07615, partial [Candidatus Woesearchaeota archaeon]|nr:hypothetical protein [Candidatus Woesearchaeota archaeon]
MEEQPVSGTENLQDIQRIVVRSNLVAAYMINMLKALLLVGGLIGAYFLVLRILGENPFEGVLDIVGIPFAWVTQGIMFVLGIVFVAIIFNTLSLTSFELVFEGDSVKYSYGSFFKISRSTDMTNVVRVNFQEYSMSRLGNLEVELTGSQDRKVIVQYVGKVSEKADM